MSRSPKRPMPGRSAPKRPALRAMGWWKWLAAPLLLWCGFVIAIYARVGVAAPSRPAGAPLALPEAAIGRNCTVSLAARDRGGQGCALFPSVSPACRPRLVSAALTLDSGAPLPLQGDPLQWQASLPAAAWAHVETVTLTLNLIGGGEAQATWPAVSLACQRLPGTAGSAKPPK